MKSTIYILISLLFFGLLSCEQDEIDPGKVKFNELSGEWYVAYYIDGTPITGIVDLLTYNTAAEDEDIFIVDDQGNFWDFKVKARVADGVLSFGSDDELLNISYESNVMLQNGKIIEDASTQPSGIVTDSIYFEVSFDDDGYYDADNNFVATPYATVYQCAGVRRTGFEEDEH